MGWTSEQTGLEFGAGVVAWVADKNWEVIDLKVTLDATRLRMITERLNVNRRVRRENRFI